MAGDAKQPLEELFDHFDLDKNGLLTGKELKYFVAATTFQDPTRVDNDDVIKFLEKAQSNDPSVDPLAIPSSLSKDSFVKHCIANGLSSPDDDFFGTIAVFKTFADQLAKADDEESEDDSI